jgi:hypothetical protein
MMRFQICAALAIVAGAGIAQAQDWNRDRDNDRAWVRHEDRQISRDDHQIARDEWKLDHSHNWVRYNNRWRYWDHDRWVYAPAEVVEVGPPVVPVFAGRSIFDLNVEIGNLDFQITDLQRGPWYRGRDERIADLRTQIRRDRDRVEWLRHH